MRSKLRAHRGELVGVAVEAAITLPFRDGYMGFLILLGASAGIWWMGYRHLRRHLRAAELARVRDDVSDAREVMTGLQDILDAQTAGPARGVLALVGDE